MQNATQQMWQHDDKHFHFSRKLEKIATDGVWILGPPGNYNEMN